MKRLVYLLLTVLLALPAVAQETTAPPVITISENAEGYTLTVTGNGMLNVQVMRDMCDFNFDILIDETQVEGTYEYSIPRSYDDGYQIQVAATAQEDGKLPSEVAVEIFMIRPYFIMPTPEITFDEDDNGVTINVMNCAGLTDVTIMSNGDVVVAAHESYVNSYSYYLERTYEDQEVYVDAINRGTAISDVAMGITADYTLTAKELPMAEAPVFHVNTSDEYVEVTAFPVEEGQTAHLYLLESGGLSEIANPWIIQRTYENVYFELWANCEAPNMQTSPWSCYQLTVPAMIIELPKTTAPTITYDLQNGGTSALIAMEYKDYEPGDITYRYGLYDETTGDYGSFTSWKIYEGEFVISSPGKYLVEAYAEAFYPDYTPSDIVSATFELVAPTEPTTPPQFSLTYVDDTRAYIVEIVPMEEGCVLYYRAGYYDEGGEFFFGDWQEYTGPLYFTEVGLYRIEAYAVVEGKTTSDQVTCEFVITPYSPSQIYDFEEAGVFYKITGEGKVSVCSETTDYNSYSGEVTIPVTVTHEGVTYMVTGIDDNAFRDCADLTGVNIGAYVTIIGDNAFLGCTSLTSVVLGDYVTKVGKKAFFGCSALADVKMGSGMRNIEEQAFQNCSALTSVTCKAATPPYLFHRGCFDCYSRATLYVYPAVLDSYQSTNIFWSQFANIVAEDKVAPAIGDTNGDGKLSISDVTTLINRLLRGY